ncbi:unnamed protein product, partial [marine sediment metagenome]
FGFVEGIQNDPLEEGDFASHEVKQTLGHASYWDYSAGFATDDYNDITFDATGIGWVQADIDTPADVKLCIRCRGDIDETQPSGRNYVNFYSNEKGNGFQPKLVITYTVPVEYEKTLTESLGLVDKVMKAPALIKTESLGLVDKVVKAPALIKAEPLGLLDTYSRTWAAHQTYSELLGLADVVSKGVVQHPLIEALGLSDTVVKEPDKVLKESLGLLDVYSRTWSVHRTYTELLGLTDTVAKGISLPLSEILGLLDTYSKAWSIQRTYT